MIQGFGYSVWAVPVEYRKIKELYGMKHIPHVTISTNHPKPVNPMEYGRKCMVVFPPRKSLIRLPKMYQHDPLEDKVCAGFYCSIPHIKEDIMTHLTMSYDFNENYGDYKAPENFEAIIYRADTTSLDPEEWTFY